jgi:hypothetical protein
MEASGQLHALAALTPEIETTVPLGQEGRRGNVDIMVKREISVSDGNRTPILRLSSPWRSLCTH